MADPVVLIAGQLLTADLWAPQVAALGERFELILADASGHDTIAAMAAATLDDAPERFSLV
ncbi:MAG TPA: alpha/beta hydrolase, partial [Caulobacteraceae bacterium]|nr:alpha/beta hydrolase [Caulobacteraceae bacterium]